jgi:hypothetical protein
MPGEHGQLAGGRDDRGLEAATGLDALVERAERPGRPAGRPGCLNQDAAHLGAAGLADPAVDRGGVPGLADLRIQPDIGDQPVRIGEAAEVADRGNNRDCGDRIHPGNGHQPGHHRIGQRFDGQLPIHEGEFGAVEVQLPQQSLHGGPFVGREWLGRQPVPAGGAEQI